MSGAKDADQELPLTTPQDFGFPFKPYDIQRDLMRHVFESIEQKRVAVVESPTGTGKSLSLICATLAWIEADKARVNQVHLDGLFDKLKQSMPHEPDWVIHKEVERQTREMRAVDEELEQRLSDIRKREKAARDRAKHVRKKQKVGHASTSSAPKTKSAANAVDESAFAPENPPEVDAAGEEDGLKPHVRAMMNKFRGPLQAEAAAEPVARKVIYATRTHSQLSQFMGEIRKTPYSERIRTTPLAGRANLCIHDELKKKCKSNDELNDRCLDLQKKGKERCPYMPPPEEQTKLESFRDEVFASVHTVEDLEDLGRGTKTCPYYGSRKAINQAQLIALPYQLVLVKETREALGLDVSGQCVVIDEAHALSDTILNSKTVSLSLENLVTALQCLSVYRNRFKGVLKGINQLYLSYLTIACKKLAEFCQTWAKKALEAKKTTHELFLPGQLLNQLELDQLPLRDLDAWMRDSKITRKISGYAETVAEKSKAQDKRSLRVATVSMLYRLQGFLVAMAEPDRDGRVILSLDVPAGAQQYSPTITLKYLLLNPEEPFRSLVEDSRSVILAGGTMSPIQDFHQQLFGYMPFEQLAVLSCGHVIPPEQLLVRSLGNGPTGKELHLTYEKRKDPIVVKELGMTLLNLAAVVKGGIVCFLPSYAFLHQAVAIWTSSGQWHKLCNKRRVFLEPQNASETDDILRGYQQAVTGDGGLLVAVVGAKLSEGINFSDALCRCVVVCSIPFPSTQSTELEERRTFLSELSKSASSSRDAGSELYNSLAFRAVNQAIGRSIRHQNDWSAIVLMDCRYKRNTFLQLLPKWIASSLQHRESYGALARDMVQFMKHRNAP